MLVSNWRKKNALAGEPRDQGRTQRRAGFMASKPTTWRTLESRRVAAEASSYTVGEVVPAADPEVRFRVRSNDGA